MLFKQFLIDDIRCSTQRMVKIQSVVVVSMNFWLPGLQKRVIYADVETTRGDFA